MKSQSENTNIIAMDDERWFDQAVKVSVSLFELDELLRKIETLTVPLEGCDGFSEKVRSFRHAILKEAEKTGFENADGESGHSEPVETCEACNS